jgi:outer membrane receptor protein involved in Fe transport
VNLVTQAGPGVRRLRALTGSYGTGELQGTLGAERGALALLASGGWQGSEGDFEYLDDNGTPLEPADDRLQHRENTRFDAASALVHGRYAPSDRLQLSAHAEYFRRGQGVPGPGSVPVHTARFGSERTTLAADSRVGNGAAWPALTLRGNVSRQRSRLRDTEGELGYGRVNTDERFDDGGFALEASSPAAWRRLALAAGGALRGENADPAAPTAGLPDPPDSRRATHAAWFTADVHGFADRLLLHAARRWDRQDEHVLDTRSTGALRVRDTRRTLDAPQLGARLRVAYGLELRGNWSRATRAPDFDELFGIDGSVTGNPLLVPEHSESWDAGAVWSGTVGAVVVSADWSHHATHSRDLILFERSSPRGARPVNVGAARLFGEETALRARWRGLELSAATAWLSATDRSPISFYHGRRLPQRAARQSSARATWQRGRWSAASDVEYLGDTYLDRANYKRAPSRTLVGASFGCRIGRTRWLAEGRNLGDRLAEDVAGFPLPGRMFLFSLTLDLGEGVMKGSGR